tara:strand:+ start:505 stop:648 length:144 start_codon:yes stop_codon:yes gene_type:complete
VNGDRDQKECHRQDESDDAVGAEPAEVKGLGPMKVLTYQTQSGVAPL